MTIRSLPFTKMPYGGDWNPEQWERPVWDEDVALFGHAGIDLLSVNIFAWTALQPDKDTYDFARLDEILALLESRGLRACLGTSTAAIPAWMATRFPDVLRTDFQGRAHKFGDRHNACPNSPTYRRFAPALAGQLARRYAGRDVVALWHVSNEFGGACYCPRCEAAFRTWLRAKYGTLDALNHAWNAAFWSQTITEWDEIVVPNVLTVQWTERSTAVQGLTLDYQRFMSDALLGAYRLEADAIRAEIPDAVITTNLMGPYRPLDYRAWAPHLDVIAWDSYPAPHDPPAAVSLKHDLMRSLKAGQPFMLMEQTPSQTNWQPVNSLKRPGVMRLQSWQAVAHGADAVMFFQMRRSVGACEKFHGAVMEHHGRTDTRVFREVAALGAELRALGDVTLGARVPARVAVWFDWPAWWAVENSMGPSNALDYLREVTALYAAFHAQGYAVDLVGSDSDLSGYGVVASTLLYLLPAGAAETITAFVEGGGTFLAGLLSGVADDSDRVFPGGPPGPLRDLLGVWVEEVDALPPGQDNEVVMQGGLEGTFACSLLFEQLRVDDAEVLATYGQDFYAGSPVLTRRRVGKGQAWKLGTSPDAAGLRAVTRALCDAAGVLPLVPELPDGVEVTRREGTGGRFLFLLNHTAEERRVSVPGLAGTDLLSGDVLGETVTLPPRGVRVIHEGAGA
ncbi:beta-galactosidase [Deinococcus metalli]|uniref:Beta-galactosidase n=1 Tax=Deinococcus metalli TaxID=1141878 RepID=A0A7W8KDX6_9DEIO|nr:beta-galactosidase [Deinococcus metalli]MBB5375958.1 beta-galactosidase [Deinococcus metalli]GHF35824.1 beta-galactosidase [Deinococcus metalli]